MLWEASDLQHRQWLARAIFDRIEALGIEQVRIFPSQEAGDGGWFRAWDGQTLTAPLHAQSLRYGRGERIHAAGSRLTRGCQVTVGGDQGLVDRSLSA